jgi:hypothetical protein
VVERIIVGFAQSAPLATGLRGLSGPNRSLALRGSLRAKLSHSQLATRSLTSRILAAGHSSRLRSGPVQLTPGAVSLGRCSIRRGGARDLAMAFSNMLAKS